MEEAADTAPAGPASGGPSRASETMNEGGERKKFRIIKIKKKPKQVSMMQTYKSNVPQNRNFENSFSDEAPEDTEMSKIKSGFEGGHSHAKPKTVVEDDDDEEIDPWKRVNLNLEEQQNRILHAKEMKEKELITKLKKLNLKSRQTGVYINEVERNPEKFTNLIKKVQDDTVNNEQYQNVFKKEISTQKVMDAKL